MLTLNRGGLRTALKYHTGNKLTSPTDLNYYLDRAELEVFGDWRKFDRELFQPVAQTVTTDSSGIALLPKVFSRLMVLYDGDEREFSYLGHPRAATKGSGFLFVGFDQTNKQRKLEIRKSGAVQDSITYTYYDVEALMMGSLDSDESAIPNEHRHIIALKASQLYYRDQGPSFLVTSNFWNTEYTIDKNKAEDWYKSLHQSLETIDSMDPDAGESPNRRQGFISS